MCELEVASIQTLAGVTTGVPILVVLLLGSRASLGSHYKPAISQILWPRYFKGSTRGASCWQDPSEPRGMEVMSLKACVCHTPLPRDVPQTASLSISEGSLHLK